MYVFLPRLCHFCIFACISIFKLHFVWVFWTLFLVCLCFFLSVHVTVLFACCQKWRIKMNIYCQTMFNFETSGTQTAKRSKKFLQKLFTAHCYRSVVSDSPCVNVRVLLDYVILLDHCEFSSLITSYCFGKLWYLLCVLAHIVYFPVLHNCRLFMVALWNRETIYILILFLLFFARLISAVGDWMFTVLRHMV